MIRRVLLSPVAFLMLVIAAILGVACLSNCAATKCAHHAPRASPRAGPRTPHLVFSTYLGGSKAFFPAACPYLRPERRLRHPGQYLRDRRHPGLRPSRARTPSNRAPAADSTMSAFVAKYNPAGHLLWCTYLGGNNQSMGVGVAAMPNGGVAVVGITTSVAPVPFPTS